MAKKLLKDINSNGRIYIDLPRGIGKRRKVMNEIALTNNELYLLTESVRLHLEDICNFPEENGENIIKELDNLLIRLERVGKST